MGKNDIVAGIRLDGEKDFKAALTSINKGLTSTKSEMALLKAEFAGQENSLEALSKKHEILTKILQEQNRKVDATRNGLQHAKESYDNVGKGLEKLWVDLEKATDRMQEMEQIYGDTSQEAKEQRKVVEQLSAAIEKGETNWKRAGDRIRDWETKLNTAQAQAVQANHTLKQNAAYLKEAEESTNKCATSIDNFGKKITKVEADTDTFGDTLRANLTSAAIEKGAQMLERGLEAAKDTMLDSSKASAQLAASTGLSESAAKRYQKVMQQIKGSNFGEDYQDVADAMSEIIQIMGELDDGAMRDITESAITLRDTFGMEVNESIRAADVMIKTMGVDATTAFDLIATGAQNGLNRSGELVDNITEYAQLWGQAGFSAQEMFAILENGLNSGAYNLDKVNDYVKEFGVSLADGRIEDNLSSFSAETAELFESWKNGEASTSDVFYSVIKDLSEMTNKQEALTVASTVWSALGEDNAMQVITALDDVNEAYSNVQGTMDELKETKFSDLESSIKNLGSALQERFIAPIADAVTPALAGMANAAADIIRPAKEQVDQFYQDVTNSTAAIRQNVENVGAQFNSATEGIDRVAALGSRLQELNGVEQRTTVQKQEMAAIVSELSQSIPELNGAYDAERDVLSTTNMELKDLIANYKESAAQKAVLAATQELVNQKLEAQVNLDKAQSGKDNAEARIRLLEQERDLIGQIQSEQALGNFDTDYQTEAMKLYQDALKNGVITMEEFKEAEEQLASGDTGRRMAVITGQFWDGGEAAGIMHASLEGLDKQSNSYNKTLEEQKKILQDCDENAETYVNAAKNLYNVQAETPDELKRGQAAFRDYGKGAEDTIPSIEEAGKTISGVGLISLETAGKVEDASSRTAEAAENSAEAQKAAADAQKEAIQEVRDAYQETVSDIESDLKNKISITDKFDGGEDLTTEKMNEILKGNLEGVKKYQENLEKVRQMTDESGKALFSPEVMREIEDGGTEYAKLLEHMVYTWENQGEYGYEQLKGIADKWGEGLDFSEQTAKAEAANRTAMDAMLNDMGSSDVDFSDLRAAIETAAQGTMQEALENTVSVAQQIGVTIPEGLAEGIASGETSPEQAIERLNSSIQGRFEGFAEIARNMGISGVDELAAGISEGGQSAIDAYNTLLQMISEATAGAGTAGVEQASGEMASAGATAAEEKAPEYQSAGEQAAAQYGTGIGKGKPQSIEQARQMAQQTLAAVRTYENAFRTAGYNMSAGVAAGIRDGKANAVNEAVRVAVESLEAAKRNLEINSPSKKFRRVVGHAIPEGTAFGISDKASLASDAADKMSNDVYTKATQWLTKYKKKQRVSISDEKWYWEQVSKHMKKGTDAYNKALAKAGKEADKSADFMAKAEKKIEKNFNVSRKSGKKKKDAETYYGEIYQAASKYLANQEILNDQSLQTELDYWTQVRKGLKKGTQAWYDATKQIKDIRKEMKDEEAKAAEDAKRAQEERVKAHVNVQNDILDKYKVYYKVSAKAEMEYWNVARKQFAVGTDERIEADQKYLEALQEFNDQRKELDEEYAENSKEINDQLKEDIADLQEAYQDAVQSRKDDILSQMDLFEAWDSEGYDADTLLYNLKTQVAGLTLWEQQLDELGKKGLSEELMDELKEMGPDAAASIYSLNHMTAEQLDEYQKMWQQKNELAQSQAVKDNEKLREETNKQITDLRLEAQSALNALNADYRAELAELNTGMSKELGNLIGRAGSIGEGAVSSLIAGIGKQTNSVELYQSTAKVVDTISAQLSALPPQGKMIGKNTLDGLLEALTNEKKIRKASKKVVRSIKREIEAAAEIHSPSRLFRRETGPQIPAGVAEGMEDGAKTAAKASRSMIRQMFGDAKEELRRQQAAMQAETAGINNFGIARINHLTDQYQIPAPVVNVDTSYMAGTMQQVLNGMSAMLKRMDQLERLQVVMYPDALIGEIREGMDKANADAATLRNRGW